jgi:hypothetical protein
VLVEGFGWNETLADTANDEVTVPEQSKETEYCQEALNAIDFVAMGGNDRTHVRMEQEEKRQQLRLDGVGNLHDSRYSGVVQM